MSDQFIQSRIPPQILQISPLFLQVGQSTRVTLAFNHISPGKQYNLTIKFSHTYFHNIEVDLSQSETTVLLPGFAFPGFVEFDISEENDGTVASREAKTVLVVGENVLQEFLSHVDRLQKMVREQFGGGAAQSLITRHVMQSCQELNKDLITLMFRGDVVIDQQQLTRIARSMLKYLLAQQLFEIAAWVLQRCAQLSLPVVSNTLPSDLDALHLQQIIQQSQQHNMDDVEVGGQQTTSPQVQLSQGWRDYSSLELPEGHHEPGSSRRHFPHPSPETEKEKKNQKRMRVLGRLSMHSFDSQVGNSSGQLWARS